jgi:hypothetical protein
MALVSDADDALRGLLDLSRALDALGPHVAGTIELDDVLPWALQATRDADPASAVDRVLDVAGARPSGPAIEIAVPLGAEPGSGALARLDAAVLRVAARAGDGGESAPRVRFVHAESFEPCSSEAFAAAFGLLRANPFACIELRPEPPPGGGGGSRRPRPAALRTSLARVTLNLPLLLMNATGDGLKEALACLDRGARLARDAFQERAWVQRKSARFGLPGIVAYLGGPGRVAVPASGQEVDLGIWGLSHALGLLVRRGLVPRPGVPEAAARLLGQLHYHVGEEKDGLQLVPRTGGCASRGVRKRLLEACEANARQLRVPDLLDELRNERAAEGALPLAVPLGDRRNKALLSARVMERLGPWLGIPEACLAGGLSPRALAEIRTTSRIGTLCLPPPGMAGLFEVQEELFA